MQDAPNPALEDLLRRLDLEKRRENHFRGTSPPAPNGRIFGGLVFAQALRAGLSTVENRLPHSAHAYFLRPGDPELPIEYEVDPIREGRSFSTRRVVARQRDEAIFNLSVSCHAPEPDVSRQIDAEIPSEPHGEAYEEGIVRGMRSRGIDLSIDDIGFRQPVEILMEGGLSMVESEAREPTTGSWIRARGALPDDPFLHCAILAYASDMTIMVPALQPLDFGLMSPGVQSASLDHAIWFHDTFRIDDWLYAVGDSHIVRHSRGMGRQLYYSRDGRLVASCVQEGLIRREQRA